MMTYQILVTCAVHENSYIVDFNISDDQTGVDIFLARCDAWYYDVAA